MRLRFQSCAALVLLIGGGIAACGDDDATGGSGGATSASSGSGTGSTSSTKSASSATSNATASTAVTGSTNASSTATADASSSVSAASTSTGQNLQLCGTDDPGGTTEECDPATQYCEEMNGGIVASQQFTCQPKPAECAGAPTCNCVHVDGCQCTLDGQMVRITCNFP